MPVGRSARLPATAKDRREKQRYLNVPESPDVPRPQSGKRTVRGGSSVAPAREEASLREEEGRQPWDMSRVTRASPRGDEDASP